MHPENTNFEELGPVGHILYEDLIAKAMEFDSSTDFETLANAGAENSPFEPIYLSDTTNKKLNKLKYIDYVAKAQTQLLAALWKIIERESTDSKKKELESYKRKIVSATDSKKLLQIIIELSDFINDLA